MSVDSKIVDEWCCDLCHHRETITVPHGAQRDRPASWAALEEGIHVLDICGGCVQLIHGMKSQHEQSRASDLRKTATAV